MGKGSNPRNCFSQQFKDNYDRIDWRIRKQRHNIRATDGSERDIEERDDEAGSSDRRA